MAGDGPVGAWVGWAEEAWAALRDESVLPAHAQRELLCALSTESPPAVWHPTGFLVLTLCRRDDGALRLHLWPEDARVHGTPCWPVHDHVWDLRSQVLCGEVQSRGYAVVDDEHGDAVLYAVGYGEGSRSCMRRSARRVSVQGRALRRIAAGEHYEVVAGEFHASAVDAGCLAATLASTRPTERPGPWVVGDVNAPRVVPVERPVADAAWVRMLLRRVAASMHV
jgi:hypothetical protein